MTPKQTPERTAYEAGWKASMRSTTNDLDAAEQRFEARHGTDFGGTMFAAGWVDAAAGNPKGTSLDEPGTDAWGRPMVTPDDGHSAYACNDRACQRHPASLYGQLVESVQADSPSLMGDDLDAVVRAREAILQPEPGPAVVDANGDPTLYSLQMLNRSRYDYLVSMAEWLRHGAYPASYTFEQALTEHRERGIVTDEDQHFLRLIEAERVEYAQGLADGAWARANVPEALDYRATPGNPTSADILSHSAAWVAGYIEGAKAR